MIGQAWRSGTLTAAPDVSVVVPAGDRPELLERCLGAVVRQSLAPGRFEVIVVDDGPSARTESVVRQVASETLVTVSYLPSDGGGAPAAVRNAGWRAAAAPIVAFTDPDAVPDREWLERGISLFADDVAGASGTLGMPPPDRPAGHERGATHPADTGLATANRFYRCAALEAVGGFDERFRDAWREDTDVMFSMLDRGWRLVGAPDAVVVHAARSARWGESLKQQREAEYNPLLYRKHPDLYREAIGHSPRWYYVAVASAVGAGGAFLLGRRRTAAALAGAWLAMTGAFAARRLRGTTKRPGHIAEMVVTSAFIPPLSIYRRIKGAVRFRTFFW